MKHQGGGPPSAGKPRSGGSGGSKPHGKPHRKRKEFAAVPLSKFGGIGKSTYDKRAKQEKERALNAARVNAYRKLQKKLGDKLAPALPPPEDDEEEEQGWQEHAAAPAGAPRQGAAAAAGQHEFDSESEQEEQEQRRQDEGQQQRQQQQPRGPGDGGRGGRHGRGGRGHDRSGRGRGRGGGPQHKPQSRLQRIAAEVQERKAAEAAAREAAQRAREERAAKLAADAKQRAAKGKLLRKKTTHGQPVMKYRVEKILSQLQQA